MEEKLFFYDTYEHPHFILYVIASKDGLSYITRDLAQVQQIQHPIPFKYAPAKLAPYMQQLKEYFAGERQLFDVPLDIPFGTAFQRKVWTALQTIPYGETISYQGIAEQIGHPQAVRAVGGANGKNPISIIIPCHRVIQKDGKLGGYSSGLDMKQYLLQLEEDNLQHK